MLGIQAKVRCDLRSEIFQNILPSSYLRAGIKQTKRHVFVDPQEQFQDGPKGMIGDS